jgi:hypothetical protein
MDMCGSSPESKLVLVEPLSTSRNDEDINANREHVARLTWRIEMCARLLPRLLLTSCLRVRIEIYQKSTVGQSVADPRC